MTQAQRIMDFITSEYSDKAEYLFEHDDTAVFRKGDKKKWYAVVMNISKRRLGVQSDEKIQVLNVKLSPDEIALLVDNKGYFPAYHMNKKHWCSIALDETLCDDEIFFRIIQSYALVKG